MTSRIVAKRYARALLEIGKEDGKYEKYGQELNDFISFLNQESEVESILTNPGFAFDGRKNLLDVLLVKMDCSIIINNFLRLLMERGRIGTVRDISFIYKQLLDGFEGITRAEVISAAPLKETEVASLASILKNVTGRKVALQVKKDPSLIGGVVARVGDLVWDGSVKSQLASLKVYLQRGDYV